MKNVGLSQRVVTEATSYVNLYVGRVISKYKDICRVITENGELTGEISGKFCFGGKKYRITLQWLGHPYYHPRFGYVLASSFGITAPFDVPDEAFMACELTAHALAMQKVWFPKEFFEK
jgi:hypothetical protein